VGYARHIVVLAAAAISLCGCAEQARISLFDDVIIDAGFPPALPNEPDGSEFRDAALIEDAGLIEGGEQLAVTSSALVLRYDFEGDGAVVEDRVGEAHAMVRGGAELDQRGGLVLDGVDDYVDMPNGVLSSRRSVTIIAWLRWAGGPCWQRIFDFGSTDAGEGRVGRATTSLFLTPSSCPGLVVTSMTERDSDQQPVAASSGMPTDRTVQVALVLDGDAAQSTIYIDGRRAATAPNAHLMSDLNDVNNWLGRSQWVQDRYLSGRYDELRIYDGALTGAEIAELADRGADLP
jgi:hypothetical protein